MQEVQATLPVGAVVGDRYKIEGLLGKGGFGAVYLVRDQRVRGNLFALKELIDTNRQERERFEFECELLKRLDHPSLPRVYRVFEDSAKNRAYVLMDYIEGPNLETLRQKQPGKRFSLPQVMSMMAPIMSVVDYLHSQHPPIIHRDIKPANIIIPSDNEQAVLVDFGIAKEYDPESTTTAVRRCSPGYGAPEQYSHGTNTRTDTYGLAATIYTLLTGAVPADAFYRMTQIGSDGVDPLEPVKSLVPSIPGHVSDAIQKAMSINANDRYATAGEFWQALATPPPGQQPPPLVVPVQLPATPVPPAASQRVYQITTAPHEPTTETRARKRGIIPLFVLLLIALAIAAGVAAALLLPLLAGHPAAHTPAPAPVHHHAVVPTPKPTQVPSPPATTTPAPTYPHVAGTYAGTIHNTSANETANLTLSLQQNGSTISGYVTISQPLLGSGPIIDGIVQTNHYIQFTVQGYNGNAPLLFTGNILNNGSMQGQYCSIDNTGHCNAASGGQGTWSASPANSGSSFILPPGGDIQIAENKPQSTAID